MSGKGRKYAGALAASALGIAGAAAIAAASPASAAPIVLGTATVKELASGQVTGVNYRHRYYGRGYYVRRFYHPRYAHSYWGYYSPYTNCRNTFPATCTYPYPYFGFVYGWHGIW
jgi:hypothetical protein